MDAGELLAEGLVLDTGRDQLQVRFPVDQSPQATVHEILELREQDGDLISPGHLPSVHNRPPGQTGDSISPKTGDTVTQRPPA